MATDANVLAKLSRILEMSSNIGNDDDDAEEILDKIHFDLNISNNSLNNTL